MTAMENLNTTFVLAILLASGFVAAKIGSLLRLPSVTGYILAGMVLGPSGLHLIPHGSGGSQLNHFTEIALMLIAFGIGEHLEIMRLRSRAKSVITIGIFEILGAFICVTLGTYLVAQWVRVGGSTWRLQDYIMLATLLGAVSVATAPAATLHVMQESGATGPLTTTLMAVVAIDNGLAIMLFGIAVSIARHMLASGEGSIWMALAGGLFEIIGSLGMGVATGIILDTVANRLKNSGEMLTAGLATLLLCGEIAAQMNFSPLLAGIAAGFTIVNRDYRDIRLFRALNAFEPPIIVLFFTLAGIHLNLDALIVAGWLGVAYFLFRVIGKISGAALGAHLVKTSKTIKKYLGLGLTPQAGVAIGLIFLIDGDPITRQFSEIIGPVVLAGVLLSELIGPVCTRKAIELAGEAQASGSGNGVLSPFAPLTHLAATSSSSAASNAISESGRSNPAPPHHQNHTTNHFPQSQSTVNAIGVLAEPQGVPMVPWTWKKLHRYKSQYTQECIYRHFRDKSPDSTIVFEANDLGIAPALARLSAILAHHYKVIPTASHLFNEATEASEADTERSDQLIKAIRSELAIMGSKLHIRSYSQSNLTRARALLDEARRRQTYALVLGHTNAKLPFSMQRILEEIVSNAPCPTLMIRFCEIFHTERILVPVVSMRDLEQLQMTISALAVVGDHQITILRLLPTYKTEKEQQKAMSKLSKWIQYECLTDIAKGAVEATDARVDTVAAYAESNDLILMTAPETNGLQKLFFGSLVERISNSIKKNMIIHYPPTI